MTERKPPAKKPSTRLLPFRRTLARMACCSIPAPCFPKSTATGAFIAFHSQSPELHKGYLVAFVPFKNGKPAGEWEIFADNFAGTDLVKPTGPIQHRPCGLAQGPDGSLYVSDDMNGAIFRISYQPGKPTAALPKKK